MKTTTRKIGKIFCSYFCRFLYISVYLGCFGCFLDAKSLQNQKITTLLQDHAPSFWRTAASNEYFLHESSNLLQSHSAKFLGSFLIDSSDFSPSFFKKFYHHSWRRLTQHTLDNQSQYFLSNRVTLSSNLGLNLATIWNYQVKIHLIKESSFMPQITVGVTHYFHFPFYDKKKEWHVRPLELHGVGVFGTISKSFSNSVKFFFGGRYVYESYKVHFSEQFEQQVQNTFPDTQQSILQLKKYTNHSGDFFTGINILSPNSDWETTLTMGTDFNQTLYWIWAKSFSIVTLGVNFQTMSVLTLRPFILLRGSF